MNNFIYHHILPYVVNNSVTFNQYNKSLQPTEPFHLNNNLLFSSLTFSNTKNNPTDTTELESIEGYLPITEDNLLGVE